MDPVLDSALIAYLTRIRQVEERAKKKLLARAKSRHLQDFLR